MTPTGREETRPCECERARCLACSGGIDVKGLLRQIDALRHRLQEEQRVRAELMDATDKYVREKENVVKDVTLIRHTFLLLKEALERAKELSK